MWGKIVNAPLSAGIVSVGISVNYKDEYHVQVDSEYFEQSLYLILADSKSDGFWINSGNDPQRRYSISLVFYRNHDQ